MNKYTCSIWRNGELTGFLGTDKKPQTGKIINVPGDDPDLDDVMLIKSIEVDSDDPTGKTLLIDVED